MRVQGCSVTTETSVVKNVFLSHPQNMSSSDPWGVDSLSSTAGEKAAPIQRAPDADADGHRRVLGSVPPGRGGQVGVQLISGVGSSVVAALATTPFDVIKTRMQTRGALSVPAPSQCVLQTGLLGVDQSVLRACCILHPESGLVCLGGARGGAAAGAAPHVYVRAPDVRAAAHRPNAYQTMLAIARTEGIPALWRGTGSNVVTSIPSVGIYLTIYEQLKVGMVQSGLSPHITPLFAGALARGVSVIGTGPLELMRTRVMAQTGTSNQLGGAGVLMRAVTQHGWRSLWRGTAPTLYRDVPFSALYWMVAEEVRGRLASRWGAPRDALSINLSAGFVAGASAAVITHPFDIIKTRAQVQEAPVSVIKGQRSESTLAALRSLVAREGFAGLYDGIGPRVLKIGPSCAIVLGSFELFKSYLC